MGSLQWSQRLSPSFPFALRRWSPCPRHLLSLTPGKSWTGFRLTSGTVHKTRPLREGHDACPLLGLPLQIRPLLLLGPSGLYSGSWAFLRASLRGTGSPQVEGWGSPLPFLFSRPRSPPAHTLTRRPACGCRLHLSARSEATPHHL